jgi:2-methylcitrate dehydratase PrpD
MDHTTEPLEQLARYAAGLDAGDLDGGTLRSAKACLLYGIAVAIATCRAQPALLAASASTLDGVGPGAGQAGATRLLDGARATASNAAFANAVLFSGRVQGDSHPCGHLGGVVIPTALAAVERDGGSGRDLLSAMVAGYEVALRIGRDHAADLSRRGFRTTPCYGVFGAAAAGARSRRFTAQAMRDVLSLSVNLAGGLREYVTAGTEESPLHAGFAARNGLQAAYLVESGLTSAPSALTGQAGFYRAYGGVDGMRYDTRLAEGLGDQFEFTSVTYKQYPACQFYRAVITGVASLRSQARGAEAQAIELRMNPYEADFIGARYTGPFRSAAQTVMSAPFCAALAWRTGTASFSGLRTFDDAAVNDLVQRVRLIGDPDRRRYEPALRIELSDGRELRWSEDGAGDASYRVDWPAALGMNHQLCEEVGVPQAVSEALADCVDRIDTLAGIAPLIERIRAAAAIAGRDSRVRA